MSALGEGEVEREARRVLRKLLLPGAHLRPDGDQYRLAARADGGARDAAPLSAAFVQAFVARGWLARAGGPNMYVLADAGAGWIARATNVDDPFAAQHQLRESKLIRDEGGQERRVTVDEAESPLARLRHRGLIGPAQFDAGEKLRVDYTLARLSPRLGVDLSQALVAGRRGPASHATFSDTVIAARQRFSHAMRAAGPGLADLLFDVCCHLRNLRDAEHAFGWPNRSARVVLAIGLDRLAEHYGIHVTGRGRMRAWSADADEARGS